MDKNKVIEAAAKLVAKGAYDKAIKEYQKILEVDPKDVRILQKMGELYQKKNDNAQAAVYFTKVAESYASDGFFLKAVALFKQVLKLDPTLVDVNLKLAELHQQLQLMGEAIAYYQIVANHYDKAGDTRRSLDTLRKMVDLDPDNVASRIKLADLYARERMQAEAVAEYRRAAENLKRNGRVDDYLRVAERISAVEPNNVELARELSEAYLQKNDHKRALAKLQVCFKADPRDVETLRLLASAFQGLGQTSKTISVYKELAKVQAERGKSDEVERIWRQVEALDPNDPDLQARRPAAAAPARRAAAPAHHHAPAHAAAPQRAAPAAAAPPPGKVNVAKLLTETDVYVKYGLHDKALDHLRKIFEVDPENIDAHEKAYAIYVAAGNHAQAGEQLLNVLRLHTRRGDAERGAPYLDTMLQQNPGHPEVPAFLSVLRPAAAAPAPADEPMGSPPRAGPEDGVLVEGAEEEIVVADEQDEVIADEALDAAADVAMSQADQDAAGQFEVEPPPVPDDEPLGEAPVVVSAEVEVIADDVVSEEIELDTGESSLPAGQPIQLQDFGDDEPATQVFKDERPRAAAAHTRATAQAPQYVPPAPSAEEDFSGVSADAEQDFSGVSADAPQVEQDYGEVSADVAQPEQDYGASADAEQDFGDVSAEPAPPPIQLVEPAYEVQASQDEAISAEDATAAAVSSEEQVEAPPDEEPAGEECDEASFFIDQGLLEEAREIVETVLIAYPDHRRATELLQRIEAGGAAPEAAEAAEAPPEAEAVEAADAGGEKDAFDLAAELAGELEELDDGSGGAEPSGNTGDFQVSFDEVFSEFKKGLQKVVKPEDVDTHYDLGIAYKEMGLVDDAIGEFTIARQGCAGSRKEIDCLNMLAMLQSMRGDFAAAVAALQEALGTEHASGETELALRFELAVAYESSGEQGKALGQFLRVQQVNPGYRDASARVEQLSQVASPEEDPPPEAKPRARGGGARKVGYV